ncbi:MAG: pseudouridine synthase [Planctomycetes bacterium]|nr:pseudouridine synthase [Planctomycetota bacterium]
MTDFLTQDIPAITGRVRAEPEDFVVDERLAYELTGEGTHLWFRIEKRELTTFEVIRRLARAFGRREDDFGHAGLKDRNAVTRQWLSLEFASPEDVEAVDIAGLDVLEVTRHGNKLKVGHLRSNRFQIRVRDTADGDEARAREVIEVLTARGLPNWFGEQRFGHRGVTPKLGRALLAGDFDEFLRLFAEGSSDGLVRRALSTAEQRGRAEPGVRSLPKRFLSLCTSAVQSEVFNRVLAARLQTLDQVCDGDIAYKHDNGACFLVKDAAEEAPRLARFEISPSAPLPGKACLRAAGAQADIESTAMEQLHLTWDSFDVGGPWSQKGGRRALRVPLARAGIAREGDDLVLDFSLPKGSYATAVLGELLKVHPIA